MSSGVTNFTARLVYIKGETQRGFQTDKTELRNMAVREEIGDF